MKFSPVLFIPAVSQDKAERRYREILELAGILVPINESYLSETACRVSVTRLPPAYQENTRVWRVSQRAGPDSRLVVAVDITDNVLEFRRAEATT